MVYSKRRHSIFLCFFLTVLPNCGSICSEFISNILNLNKISRIYVMKFNKIEGEN